MKKRTQAAQHPAPPSNVDYPEAAAENFHFAKPVQFACSFAVPAFNQAQAERIAKQIQGLYAGTEVQIEKIVYPDPAAKPDEVERALIALPEDHRRKLLAKHAAPLIENARKQGEAAAQEISASSTTANDGPSSGSGASAEPAGVGSAPDDTPPPVPDVALRSIHRDRHSETIVEVTGVEPGFVSVMNTATGQKWGVPAATWESDYEKLTAAEVEAILEKRAAAADAAAPVVVPPAPEPPKELYRDKESGVVVALLETSPDGIARVRDESNGNTWNVPAAIWESHYSKISAKKAEQLLEAAKQDAAADQPADTTAAQPAAAQENAPAPAPAQKRAAKKKTARAASGATRAKPAKKKARK